MQEGAWSGQERRGIAAQRPGVSRLLEQVICTAWQDERRAWRWAGAATELHTERGFWTPGEAIVDAAVTCYPASFDDQALVEKDHAAGSPEPCRRVSKGRSHVLSVTKEAGESGLLRKSRDS